jgi:hypothetical protein
LTKREGMKKPTDMPNMKELVAMQVVLIRFFWGNQLAEILEQAFIRKGWPEAIMV